MNIFHFNLKKYDLNCKDQNMWNTKKKRKDAKFFASIGSTKFVLYSF